MENYEFTDIEYSEPNVNIFVNYIKQTIDEILLIDENVAKKSKRSLLCNPWIILGIISYVNKKNHSSDRGLNPPGIFVVA